MSTLIEIKDLVTNFYTYEGVVKALNKVSLDIQEGTTFGLVGESGCGKSVLVRSIMRIIQSPGVIEGGQVIFHNRKNEKDVAVDLLQQTEEYMQGIRGSEISMIFQEPNSALNPILSIGDQVSESFMFHVSEEMCAKVLNDLNSLDDHTFFLWKVFLKTAYQIGSQNSKSSLLKFFKKIPILKKCRWAYR